MTAFWHSWSVRLLTSIGLATLTAAGLLAAVPSAAFGGGGGGSRELPAALRDGRPEAPRPGRQGGGGQSADRPQQVLATCRARGFADGSDDQRRCAERLLGDTATLPQLAPTTAPPVRTPPVRTPPVPRPLSAAAPPAPRRPVVTDRGIVQAATPDALVLRALDGSSLVVPVDGRTQVYVGGRAAAVADIQPGSVVTVRYQQAGPAIDIRVALPPKPKLRSDRGITESASADGIVIRLRDGTTKSIAVGGSTRVEAPNGRDAPPAVLRAGLLVDVLYDPAGVTPAQSVKIIRRVP